MTKFVESLEIEASELGFWNGVLDMEDKYEKLLKEEGTIKSFFVRFANGNELRIVLNNGQNNSWLDILLVDDEGHELKLIEPSFEFPTGKIELEYDGNKYIVNVEPFYAVAVRREETTYLEIPVENPKEISKEEVKNKIENEGISADKRNPMDIPWDTVSGSLKIEEFAY